ncbi:uncharacterized protein LOC126819177 [Patella vulgata]|uniref:uncharacterized protein LOC126819177 n=1 Tax=Patella vulgata TaxID=6465 RepID=UPI0021801F31|nr:uncharacterized protein LOC126819177 [Patella vulgata]
MRRKGEMKFKIQELDINIIVIIIISDCFKQCETLSLLPYGLSAGDQTLEKVDDRFAEISVDPFEFYGNKYSKLYINDDGVISFITPLNIFDVQGTWTSNTKPFICIYCTDIYVQNGGNVFYHLRTDSTTISNISSDLRQYQEINPDYNPGWVFVATWESVKSYANNTSEGTGNTFQVIVASDGNTSVVIFQYQTLNWVIDERPDQNYPDEPVDIRTQVGFNSGNGADSFLYPDSGSEELLTIVSKSNVEDPGKFIYQVDTTITEFTQRADTTTQATTPETTTGQATTLETTTAQATTLETTTAQATTLETTTAQTNTPEPTAQATTLETTTALTTTLATTTVRATTTNLTQTTEVSVNTTTTTSSSAAKLLTVHFVLIGVAGVLLIILAVIFVIVYLKMKIIKPSKNVMQHNHVITSVAPARTSQVQQSNGDINHTRFKIPRPKISNRVHAI